MISEVPSLLVSHEYAKNQKFQDGETVFLKTFKPYMFPMRLKISTDMKNKKLQFVQNGCSDELELLDSTIYADCEWLYAKTIVFSFHKNANVSFESLKSRENWAGLVTEVKKELLRHNFLYFNVGTVLKFKFLTGEIFLVIKLIDSLLSQDESRIYDKIVYKCFKNTQIFIREFNEPNMKNEKAKVELIFSQFGGYKNEINELKVQIEKFFNGEKSKNGILISGIMGTGKSLIGNILKQTLAEKFFNLEANDSINQNIETDLNTIFKDAQRKAPCIIFLDNLNDWCVSREKNEANAALVNALLNLMDGIQSSTGILVIGTSSNPENLDAALRRPGRLSHDIYLKTPTEIDRFDIIQTLFEQLPNYKPPQNLLDMIAAKTSGFVAADLLRLISEAFSYVTLDDIPQTEHFIRALSVVKPASLRNVSSTVKSHTLADVIGYELLKKKLLISMKMPLEYRHIFAQNDLSCPSRFIIFGPPGCGKTFLVQALASHYNMSIVPVRRSNIFGKYFGESEKNLSDIFDKASKSSPCILHFENFEGLAGRKHKNAEISNDVEGRVINQLKILLDGIVAYEEIIVMAETNRPDLLDKDVIRPGRFHKYFYFDLPDDNDRRKIIEKRLDSTRENFDELVGRTEGFTVAELNSAIVEIKSLMKEENFEYACEEFFQSSVANTTSKMMKKFQDFAKTYCR